MCKKMSNGTEQAVTSTYIRDLFPSLSGVGLVGSKSGWALLNNAACSQTPRFLIDREIEYVALHNFNTGESSLLSKQTTEKLESARDVIKLWLNAGDEIVVLGQSVTLLVRLLSIAYGHILVPGDEIVVCTSNHECNISPWLDLQKQGVIIRFWEFNQDGYTCGDDVTSLVNSRTKILTFSHTSNLLGEVNNCKELIKTIRAINNSVIVIVDGAQYVPHKCPDVQEIDCNFYFFASYKACAPGFGVLYGKKKDFDYIPGFGNRYQDKRNYYKQFEIGGSFQAGSVFAFRGIADYFNTLLRQPICTVCTRDIVVRAYQVMERFEQILITKFIEFLLSKSCFRLFGPKTSSIKERVGIISFQHSTLSPYKIEQVCSSNNLYVRQSHLQAYRVCDRLGIALDVGVVRVSFMHYNTVEEVDKLIGVLDRIEELAVDVPTPSS